MNVSGQKIGVAGLGARTGVSLVRYLCSKNAKVFAYDARSKNELTHELDQLHGLSFELECGTETPKIFDRTDMLLISPGISIEKTFLVNAMKAGKKVWSEVEFAARQLKSPLIAITGTNGKSTTTSLLGHIFKTWKKKTFVGGNLGTPLVEALDHDYDFVIAEISSFQMEAVDEFHPKLGMVLNVSPNHLDRHKTFENYKAHKEKIFARMIADDIAILNGDDPHCVEMASRIKAKTLFFSHKNKMSVDISKLQLFGKHNQENAMAAVLAAQALGCPDAVIEDGLSTFEGLAHRLEFVGEIQGVRFVNDSKSTTPDSAIRALEAFDTPVLWLAGGKGKGALYGPILNVAQKHVAHAFFYGDVGPKMASELSQLPQSVHTRLEDAFTAAMKHARPGSTVLLSPANASFDQFKDFEHRGEFFKTLVASMSLKGGCA